MVLKTNVLTSQGPREYMEDTYSVQQVGWKKNIEFLGVFDGHGGDEVSKRCESSFASLLTHSLLRFPGDMPVVIRNAFSMMDKLVSINVSETTGSTAAIALVDNDKTWFANAGDSMSMIITNNGKAIMCSDEHKADHEKDRIQSLGGIVTYWDGVGRVNGTLNVSRSIGDYYMKKFVISDPYIKQVNTDIIKYIVVASDGIWDVYEPDELKDDILVEFDNKSNTKIKALENIIKNAYKKGSTDNITLMVSEIVKGSQDNMK